MARARRGLTSRPMVLRIPEPYDFELSTARFRDFGSDSATVCTRAACTGSSRAARCGSTAAEGGVAIEPWSEEAADEVGAPARAPVRSRRVPRLGAWTTRRSAMVVEVRAGFPPDAEPAALRGTRRRDHGAADLAPRGGVHPRQPRRALRRAATSSPGSSRRASGSRSSARGTSRRSASRARRPSTCSSSRTPISISTRSPRSTTMR